MRRKHSLLPSVLLASMLVLTFSVTGCGDDDPTTPPNESPMVELTAPAGGELVAPGSVLNISWTASDDKEIASITLSYTDDSQAGAFTQIAADQPATGTFAWTTPANTLYGVTVKAVATDSNGATGEAMSEGIFAVVSSSPRGYVTSLVCKDCHAARYDEYRQSGHPYKINKVVNGQAPTYPYTSVPNPPTGFSWNDITYVIGGYGWKARFMDLNGYILVTGVTGVDTQYNLTRTDLGLDDTEWVAYDPGVLSPKPFTCGTCHTTGWQTFADNGGVHQDGLEGILGTWEEPGITCEACHGPGGNHVATQSGAQITISRESELCGSCHFRDTNHRIAASGGFIKHHEQYDEMISAGHSFQKCTTCHDPHLGVKHGNGDRGGIRVDCESSGCHSGQTVNHIAAADCVDCHMARFSKSARKTSIYSGDIRTHIFKIDSDKTIADMFYEEDGSTFAQGFITLDISCYQCHKDADGVGGTASMKTIEELRTRAATIHGSSKPVAAEE